MLAKRVNDAFLRKELGFGLVSISHPSKGTMVTLLGWQTWNRQRRAGYHNESSRRHWYQWGEFCTHAKTGTSVVGGQCSMAPFLLLSPLSLGVIFLHLLLSTSPAI